MKRGSFLGPILLIVIGVLFLLKNLRPDLRVVETALEYWPWLLIAWGVVRLAEILVQWSRGTWIAGRPGLNGGEWALMIIVAIAGVTFWNVQKITTRFGPERIRIGGMEVFGEPFDYALNQTSHKTGATPRIRIENLRGSVRFVGVDGDQMTVSGRKTVRSLDRGAADRVHNATPLEVSEAGGIWTIKTNQERAESEARISTDLEIKAPRGAVVETQGRSGDIDIADVKGEVSISSDSGAVRLQNLGAGAKVNLRRGDLVRAIGIAGDLEIRGGGRDLELENIAGQVMVEGSYSGESSFRNISKPIRFESSVTEFRAARLPGQLNLTLANLTATDIVGPVTVTARSKDVELNNVTDSVTVKIERGDIELRQSKLPLGGMDIVTQSGDVQLAIPANAKLNLTASTDRGSITNDYSESFKEEEQGRGAKLTGGAANAPQIRLLTGRGEVFLRKIGAGEVSETPSLPSVTPKAPRSPAPPPPPTRSEN